jgi:4-diphosphocytidyl-2-C-methyl-D-erythritol kinase
MPVFTETARAKVNLTLEVLGRRPDGYHELASLVAFADVGDIVTLDTDSLAAGAQGPAAAGGDADNVTVSGPFAAALVGDNLITATLRRLARDHPALQLGAVHLDKRLPVAAGIGGGSADAAAVLRAVRRANPLIADVPWAKIAASLGADVPVCLGSTSVWMTGIGNILHPLPGLPALHAVLVNARGAVPPDKTAQVFRALDAPPLDARPMGGGGSHDTNVAPNAAPVPATLRALAGGPQRRSHDAPAAALVDVMRQRGNALQSATQQIVPDVAAVLAAVRATQPAYTAMSGAGPTCFGIFASSAAAETAATALLAQHPLWWVAATEIG